MMSAPSRSLRIAIATSGRFHVLDLARELHSLGHDVRFYSALPKWRTRRFGLPDQCAVFMPEVLPLWRAGRYTPQWLHGGLARLSAIELNKAVMRRLRPCDVFIGMSGTVLEAAEYAQRRFGAILVLERGSRHVLSQAEILSALPGVQPPSQFTIQRELAGYDLVDRIAVPSTHVRVSFSERGIGPDRLLSNCYGVDLSMFRPRIGQRRNPRQILFVGRWGLRKGADVLERAVRELEGVTLLHAGIVEDHPFPNDDRFRTVGSVDQTLLPEIYAQCQILALPSREEGLALVLIQALASGLPVVCSDRSGGEDLRELIDRPEAVTITPVDDVEALKAALTAALDNAPQLVGSDLLGVRGRGALSWSAYAKRYSDELLRLMTMKKSTAEKEVS